MTRTRNVAAVDILVSGLTSADLGVRSATLAALAQRPETTAHEAVLAKLPQVTDAELADVRAVQHRMHGTLAAAIASGEATRCDTASRAILALAEFELLPALVGTVERAEDEQSMRVASTLVRLASMLHEVAANPQPAKSRRDPFFARRQALSRLGESLDRWEEHQRLELVEAFLLIAPPDDPRLANLLATTNHPCHGALMQALASSPAPGVMRLLVDLLHDSRTPQHVLELIAGRTDRRFLGHLLHAVGSPTTLRVLRNMQRLDRVAWLQADRDVILALDGKAQAAAVELAMATALGRSDVYALLADVLRQGAPEGREASCHALAEFPGPWADSLVLKAFEDRDVAVRAAAAAQLRRRSVVDAISRLEKLLDAPEPALRQAARTALSDFNFSRFASNFVEMTPEERAATGAIVGKVDQAAAEGIVRELASPSPTQRERAMEMAVCVGLVDCVVGPISQILDDPTEDMALRCAAARALGESQNPESRESLEKAAADYPPGLRTVAEEALQKQNANARGQLT